MKKRVAKILEVGPYPPPLAGWSIRIRYVREYLNRAGHDCRALNIGKMRKIPSEEYITVRNRFDYIWKTFYYAARGYTMHMHVNGDGPVGLLLAMIAAVAGCVCFRRIVLTLHAGIDQRYFPRDRSKHFLPLIYLLFRFSKKIICNNEAVKEKIVEFGISPKKVVPIKAFSTAYVEEQDVSLPSHVEEFFAAQDPVIFTYFFLREGFHLDAFVDGLRLLVDDYPQFGIVNAGALEDFEAPVKERILRQIDEQGLDKHICFSGDLEHDQFLMLARRSKLYLRTPTSDGESSSVLEALTLGVPVVAAENDNRPPSVITYQHKSGEDLRDKVVHVLENHQEVRDQIVKPPVRDTVADEAAVLIQASLGTRADLGPRENPPAEKPTSATASST